jgi:fibronectin-binding autotransporter adhesin
MRVINSVGSISTPNGQISKLTPSRLSRSGSPRRQAARAAILAGAVLLCTTPLQTALASDVNATFTNHDLTNLWSDAVNWTPSVVANNGNGGNNYLVDVLGAVGAADVNADFAIDGLTVETSGLVNILNADELAIGSGTSSTLTNNGTITINSNGGPNTTDLKFSSAGVNLLTGSGSVVLPGTNAQSEVLTATGSTLTVGALQAIKGGGTIAAAMTNNGTINADNSGGTMILQSDSITNTNIMEATGGGNLSINNITVTNSGTIEATGTGSLVTFITGTVISGGTLTSGTGGSIVQAIATTGTLENGVTISSGTNFNVLNDGQTNISNTLTNNGTITVNPLAGPNGTLLDFSTGSVLAGTGTVVLDSTGTAAELNGALTQNVGSSITGIGQINAVLTNNGTVNANVSGGTLSLLSSNMTNGATMEATGGGILAIGGITITNTGTIQATGTGSSVTLSNTTISGGTLSSGTGDSIVSVGSAVTTLQNSVTIATGTTYNILNDGQTSVNGKLTNNGTITVNSTAGANGTDLDFIGTGVNLLTGTGSVVLPGTNLQSEVTTAAGSSLTVDTQQTIKGAGTIAATMTNNGTINADISGSTMTLDGDPMSNTSIMEATGGGNLTISGITITNTGGTIKATGNNGSGTNSTLTLSNATISGGTLTSDPADSINSPGSESTTLQNGVTISSGTIYNILNAGQINVSGTLTNNGTITVNSTGGANTTVLNFLGTGVNLLTGSGSVVLPGTNAQSEVTTNIGSSLTVDTLQTIKGAGTVAATLTNNGTINADISGSTMTLDGDPMSNTSIMEATGGGNLTISGITITNTGTIKATGNNGSGTNSSITINNATISGGTLSADSADSINSPGSETTTLQSGVTISTGTHYNLLNDSQTNVSNTLTNNGTITVNSTAGPNGTILDFSAGSVLAGAGTVVLNSNGTAAELNGALTQNSASSITGIGQINAALTNNGTVNANVGAGTLTLQGNPMSNGGTMEATGGGNLTIGAITITNTGGTIKATGSGGGGNSSVTLAGATITGGALSTDSSGNILGFGTSSAVVTNNGFINANVNGQTLNINGNITGTGTLIASNGGDLVIGTNTGGSSQDAVSVTGGSSKIDLTNNHLFINYGGGIDPAATIRSLLTTGYAGGAWTGSGIDSSTAALPANNPHFGLGYADGVDGVVAGLTSGQIEIAYTLYGDANLDGIVSGDDFTILVANLGKSVTRWDQGDFNYDGTVSGDDFTLLVANLGKHANGADVVLPASDLAAIDAFAQANGLMADVPEPASLGFLAMTSLAALGRRRRRSGSIA